MNHADTGSSQSYRFFEQKKHMLRTDSRVCFHGQVGVDVRWFIEYLIQMLVFKGAIFVKLHMNQCEFALHFAPARGSWSHVDVLSGKQAAGYRKWFSLVVTTSYCSYFRTLFAMFVNQLRTGKDPHKWKVSEFAKRFYTGCMQLSWGLPSPKQIAKAS